MKLIEGKNYFKNIGLLVPEVLLPNDRVDPTKWACIAVDQYTSSPEYWQNYYTFVGNSPSAAKLVLPELCLTQNVSLRGEKQNTPVENRIAAINSTMEKYLEDGTLSKSFTGLIYVERTLPSGKIRKGLIAALDLEEYSLVKGAKTLIRATEETVMERIPPRLKVRQDASLELPHSLVLVDDTPNGIGDFLANRKNSAVTLYDFELSGGSGRVAGYGIDDPDTITSVAAMLVDLKKDDALYFVGDGNHSFAAAKAHWDALKKAGAPMDHPARFMLTEIESIHDPAIILEPIHRVIFNHDFDSVTALFKQYFKSSTSFWREYEDAATVEDIESFLAENNFSLDYSIIAVVSGIRAGCLYLDHYTYPFPVAAITDFIDYMLPDSKIDYVHGTEDALKLTEGGFSTAICLPKPNKRDIFAIASSGKILPRKTFSMGEAETKRFYVEARKIKQ